MRYAQHIIVSCSFPLGSAGEPENMPESGFAVQPETLFYDLWTDSGS